MNHDINFHDINLMSETADTQLLSIGENQVAYISILTQEMLSNIAINAEELPQNNELWGVYSASGELLVVCDNPVSAWEYINEHELVTVRTH